MLEGSAHGGQQALARLGAAGGGAAAGAAAEPPAALPAQPAVLDAIFLETGFKPAESLGAEQVALLQKLNALVSNQPA